METARFEALARRPDEEGARQEYPAGFPEPIDVPAGRYTDAAFFALEKRHVLESSWLFVAHEAQLPRSGDFLRLDGLDRMGHPIFLVRGRDQVIRAFYNACRHRGGPLIDAPSGSTGKTLVCKYHAWTYDLEGTLLGFPEARNFPRGRSADCPPLKSVECDRWGPLVFVRLVPGGIGLRESLEPVATELDGLLGDSSDGVHFAGAKHLDIDCNWKLAGDGNIETYHVPFLHRQSASPFLDEKRTGQWLLPRGHSRMLIRFRRALPEALPLPRFAGASLAELGVYSFHVFPNLSIVFGGPTSGFLISAFPETVGRSFYAVHFLSPVAPTPETEPQIEASIAANWAVLLEDLDALLPAQKAMACGAADVLRLQYQERRIRYVHEEIDRRIGAARVAAALRVPPLLDAWVEES